MHEHDPLDLQLAAMFEADAAGAARGDVADQRFSILTVCTGNICRSPLVEVMLRRELESVAVRLDVDGGITMSSGLGALVGAGADPIVAALGREFGVDLARHTARQFAAEQAEAAQIILTATRAQRDEAMAVAPAAATRCFTLAEFARLLTLLDEAGAIERASTPMQRPARINRRLQRIVREADALRQLHPGSGGDDIEDPYRQSVDVHRRVAEQIRSACMAIGAILRSAVG